METSLSHIYGPPASIMGSVAMIALVVVTLFSGPIARRSGSILLPWSLALCLGLAHSFDRLYVVAAGAALSGGGRLSIAAGSADAQLPLASGAIASLLIVLIAARGRSGRSSVRGMTVDRWLAGSVTAGIALHLAVTGVLNRSSGISPHFLMKPLEIVAVSFLVAAGAAVLVITRRKVTEVPSFAPGQLVLLGAISVVGSFASFGCRRVLMEIISSTV